MDKQTFFFYDLETSGLSASQDRIMQFAGQRTDTELNPIGEPVNLLIKLANDTLPSPTAIMVTKITPQQTQTDGMTEAEFCKYVTDEIFTENTCAIGYNSVRFDDEFMRYTFWRNFCDPYIWQWKDGRSRWDMLDVVRLTRALRPDGIKWPTQEIEVAEKDDNGKPTGKKKKVTVETNRLEIITKLNGITHTHAHDALSDVEALIDVTRLIKKKQPKLYDYLYKMRDKKQVARLVNLDDKRPFVYACGRYPGENHKTSIAFPLTAGRNGNVLVFDLRYNLDDLLEKEVARNKEIAKNKEDKGAIQSNSTKESTQKETRPFSFFPVVKELCLNKCPAVSPIGVLDAETTEEFAPGEKDGDKSETSKKPLTQTGWQRINLDKETVEKNLKSLLAHPDFAERMREKHENRPDYPPAPDAEGDLYDGFLDPHDANLCNAVRNADENRLADFHPPFNDERLPDLLLHYKARNYPKSLAEDEVAKWEEYRLARLNRQLPNFMKQMEDLKAKGADDFLLEELMLWYQSLE